MLRIYEVALGVVRDLNPVLDRLKRKSPALHDQLERALRSVVLAIAEGSRSRGKNRQVHYARGTASMDESIANLAFACTRGYIEPIDPVVHEKMKRVVGTLTICAR